MIEVTLPPELEQSVEWRVRSGRYPDVNAVMREALLALDAQEAVESSEAELERIKVLVRAGREQARRGMVVDGPTFTQEIITRLGG